MMASKRVLVAPLDWGLGHATRCIPIINLLIDLKCEVIIAGSGASLALLEIEFPSLKFFELPAYNPIYPSHGSMTLKMISQLPKFFKVIKKEHAELEKIVQDENIDVVISDNRFGCWSSVVKSIFITHQINILMPDKMKWLAGIVNHFNHKAIKKYDICWVPDDAEMKLSGKLSKTRNVKTNFIGWLSRFRKSTPSTSYRYKVLAILSGPEPQRHFLEKILLTQLSQVGVKSLLVRGVPGKNARQIFNDIEIVDFLNTEELLRVLNESEIIISRSGYSTIMDLIALGKRAILIPTPGQTEQEYLANELHKKSIAYTSTQRDFDLEKALKEVVTFTGFHSLNATSNSLEKTISDLVK